MKITVEVIGLLMVAFTLLTFIQTTNRWVRMLDFPRIQIAFLLLLSLATYTAFFYTRQPFSMVWVGLLLLAFVLQIRMIFPFTVFSPTEAIRSKSKRMEPNKRALSMMVSNVRMDNEHKQRFLALVKQVNPDLLLINEPDEAWAVQLRSLSEMFAYSVQNPLPNTYGMMLFSKLPLHDSQVLYRVEEGIPSIVTEVELPSGERFCFYGLHPQPPTYANNTEKREAELLIVGKEVKKSGLPSIVAGDLNDVGWSHTTGLFKKISGMLDPRVGRGFYSTYNVFVPLFRYPLDHIFYTPHFELVHMERLPAFGSDHFPILIQLCFAPQKQAQQQPEQADREEKEKAEELIQEGVNSASKGYN